MTDITFAHTTKSFSFWQKWLVGIASLLILLGLDMVFFHNTPLFDALFNRQIDHVFWGTAVPASAFQLFQGWIYGVLGATSVGWGIFIIFIAQVPFRQRQSWAWACMAWGIGSWFVLDTAVSLFYHVTFNALFNTFFFILAILPLIFTRSDFQQQ